MRPRPTGLGRRVIGWARLAVLSLSLSLSLNACTSAAVFAPLEPDSPGGLDSAEGHLLWRDALSPPARYRVLVVPGSGCESLAPSVDRLARGLLHAQVMLLQKPHLQTAVPGSPRPCHDAFVQADSLAAWLDRAMRLAGRGLSRTDPSLPLVLVGLSEGAELLPGLAAGLPDTVLLVLIGHAGLDPAEIGRLQAARLGQTSAWQAMVTAVRSAVPDDRLVEGRHRRYWSDLLDWPLAAALMRDPRPLLQVRGGRDLLMPDPAYTQFAAAAQEREGGYCHLVFAQADHELREPGADRLQWVWHWLEQLARERRHWRPDCNALQSSLSTLEP